jgi:Tol biopolymer transport system component
VVPAAHATFPGKNGKIAFFGSGIETIEPDGSGLASLIPGRDPTWSADGASLAYVNGFSIFTANADGSNGAAIPQADGESPSWSPDGSKIAFESTTCFLVACARDLHTINRDGTEKSPSIVGTFNQTLDPTWSPNGETIAHVNGGTVCDESGAYCNAQIYTIHPDGSGVSRITDDVYYDFDPSWSPDGSRIAFASARDGYSDIYTINTDGTGLTRLTDDPGVDRWPTWSPDGRKIAFISSRDDLGDPGYCGGDPRCNLEIYVMNADGTQETRLTNSSTPEVTPDWQPLVGPKRSDYKNAAQFCKALRNFLGDAAFRNRYGGGANAHGKCVSGDGR